MNLRNSGMLNNRASSKLERKVVRFDEGEEVVLQDDDQEDEVANGQMMIGRKVFQEDIDSRNVYQSNLP